MFLLWLRQLPWSGDQTPASVHPPHPHLRAGPVLLTFLFFPLLPSSYWVLHGSVYSFLLVRYSSPLSAGVLHALLCLKVCSWYIHWERYTPCPPTPLPSCSSLLCFSILIYYQKEFIKAIPFTITSKIRKKILGINLKK